MPAKKLSLGTGKKEIINYEISKVISTIVKIFWQENCPHCPDAKKLGKKLEKDGVKVEYHDVRTVDGLAEATFFDVMSTPSIIIVDGKNKEIISWCGKIPDIEEVRKYLE